MPDARTARRLNRAHWDALAAVHGIEFVEAEATALPTELRNRFDLVYATVGVICWIDDMTAWMRSAAAALRSGGRLLLVDLHPLHLMVAGTDPLELDA